VGDQELPRSETFKYLGVELHGTRSISVALQHRLACMVRAHSSVCRRLHALHTPRDPELIAGLFDSITAAAGSYGCEIWSTPFLGKWHLRSCTLQRYQAAVYKQALGVTRGTSNLLAFYEMGRYPLQLQWLYRTVKYWNKLVSNKAASALLGSALTANVHQGLGAGRACWVQELHDGLRFVRPEFDWKDHLSCMKPIKGPRTLLQDGKACFDRVIQSFDGDPLDPGCEHRQRCKYQQWMYAPGDNDTLRAPAYISQDMPLKYKQALARLRLSGAGITANQRHDIGFSARVCLRCSQGIDHEHHLLFDCTDDRLQQVRHAYQQLFAGVGDVQQWMQGVYDVAQSVDLAKCAYDMLHTLEG